MFSAQRNIVTNTLTGEVVNTAVVLNLIRHQLPGLAALGGGFAEFRPKSPPSLVATQQRVLACRFALDSAVANAADISETALAETRVLFNHAVK